MEGALENGHIPILDSSTDNSQFIDFGFSFSLFYAVKNGLGLHSRDIPSENLPALNQANYAFTVLYVSALPFRYERPAY